MPNQEPSTWSEYSRLVLAQMEANTLAIKELGNNMHVLRGETNTQLGQLRLQFVQELAQLEGRVNSENRKEVIKIREHFDEQLEFAQKTFDSKIGDISRGFEARVKELNALLQEFVKTITKQVADLSMQVSALQVKAGLWGAAGSILGVLAVYLLSQLPKLVK